MYLAALESPDLINVAIAVVVLVFGISTIPKLARNLGSVNNELKRGLKLTKVTQDVLVDTSPRKSVRSMESLRN